MSKIEEILGKDINSLKELREEIKRLQDEMAGLDTESQQFKDDTEKLSAAQDQLAAVTRKNKQENEAAKDSIVGMEQEYRKLYNTYKMLTEEQRNSAMGKQMAKDLNELSEKLNDVKKGVGNFKDNIGRYTSSIIDAFKTMGGSLGSLAGPLKAATTGMNGLNAAMKVNPIGIIVGAIVALMNILKKFKEAINNNEESQMRWNEAMSAFQPWVDAVKNGLDALSKVVLKFVEGVASAVRWVRSLFNSKDGDKVNKTYKELAKTQNELVKRKREYQVLNSQEDAEVQRLREEISLTSDKVEKQKLINEAKEIQGGIDARNIEIAEEELRIALERAKLSPNSAADNQKIADLEKAVADAQAAAARNQRALNKGLVQTGGNVDNLKEKAKELYDELIKDSKDRVTQLREEYNEQKKLLEKYGYDTTLLTKKYEKEIRVVIKEEAEKTKKDRLAAFNESVAFKRKNYDLELNNEKDNVKKTKKVYERANADYEGFLKSREDLTKVAKRNSIFEETYKDAKKILKTYSDLGLEVDQYTRDEIKKMFGDKGFALKIDKTATAKEIGEYLDEQKGVLSDKLSQMAEVVNNKFGTDIKIPPQIDKDNLQEFFKQMDLVAQAFGIVKDAAKDAEIEADIKAKIDLRVPAEAEDGMMADYAESVKEWAKGYVADLYDTISNEDLNPLGKLFNKSIYSLEEVLALRENIILDNEIAVSEAVLANDEITAEKRKEIEEKLFEYRVEQYQRLTELNETFVERNNAILAASFSSFDTIASSIQTVTSSYQSLIQAQLQDGKITKKEAAKKEDTYKKLEKIAMWVNIAQIAASTAGGIMEIWKGYAAERAANAIAGAAAGVGAPAAIAALNAKSLATAIINTTALATQGAAQIAAARMGTITKLMSFSQSSAGSDVTPTVTEIASSPYTYTRNIQNESDNDVVNQPIWVSVQDIESALDRQVNVKNETHF